MDIKSTIFVPSVFKDLSHYELTGEESCAKNRTNLDDTQAYYDDNRMVTTTLDNGKEFSISLSSGQSNYWVDFLLDDEVLDIEADENDNIIKFVDDENTYEIIILS